jgi:hypothetical protein
MKTKKHFTQRRKVRQAKAFVFFAYFASLREMYLEI